MSSTIVGTELFVCPHVDAELGWAGASVRQKAMQCSILTQNLLLDLVDVLYWTHPSLTHAVPLVRALNRARQVLWAGTAGCTCLSGRSVRGEFGVAQELV